MSIHVYVAIAIVLQLGRPKLSHLSMFIYVLFLPFFLMLITHGSPCQCFVPNQHFIVDVVVTQV
jgi:hypothetical protein